MKRIVRLAVVVVGLVALLAVLLPNLVSDDLVKRRIADRIAGLTGRVVVLKGAPSLSIYPHLAVSVGDLTISNTQGAPDDPFITAESLTTRLRVLPLLLGRIDFDEFELDNPRIHLVVDRDGRGNWRRPTVGKDAKARAAAASESFGNLTIVNGTVVYDNLASDRHEEMTGVNLDATWPQPQAALSGTGTLQWRGETVEFSGLVAKPLELAAGNPSPARFAIGSTPLRVLFNGTLKSLDDYEVDGEASVTTPSLRRTIEWLGTPMGTGSTLGAASIKGKVKWSGATIAFSGAKLELDGNAGEGTLSARFAGGRPTIAGSLTFAKLDLSPYVEAMRASFLADGNGAWLVAPARLPIVEGMDANVQATAEQVLIGALRIGKAKLAAIAKNQGATVNIDAGQFYGGRLYGQFTATRLGDALSAHAKATVTAVPARVALSDLAKISVLDGTSTAVVDIGSRGQNWGEFAQATTGTLSFAITDGSLTGVDVHALAAMASDPLAEPIGPTATSTAFKRMTGTLAVAGGVLETDDLVAEGDGFHLAIDGWGSVLSGLVDAKATLATVTNSGKTRDVPLTISGSWWEPQFALDRERMKQQQQGAAPPRG